MKPIVTKKYLGLFIQNSTQRVLEFFFRFPDQEFSLSDIAREAGVAKPHIGEILAKLELLGFIKITKLAKIWRIKANFLNENFIKSKMVYNLNFMYQSGLVGVLVEHFKNPKVIVLFGSFRKGEDLSTSDIDIAIEMDEMKEYETKKLQLLFNFEKEIGRKIQLHIFDRNSIDLHVFNNIANGIVLVGFLEVKL